MIDPATNRWALPYIDQPLAFWEVLAHRHAGRVMEVYFPLPLAVIGSGRPEQPCQHLEEFLHFAPVEKAALLNAVTLPGPVGLCAPAIIEHLRSLMDGVGICGATVANLRLAEELRKAIPALPLTASVLMEINHPNQAMMLNGVCDVLVPGGRAMRHLPSLKLLRKAFHGRLRLLVNEGCLGGCPYRIQHFHEMCSGVPEPESLCDGLLERQPWLRLTGAWVTPQHLHYFDGCYDELKLAGRVTLQDPERYMAVVDAYMTRTPLSPSQIGGGPSSVIEDIEMPDELYAYTLQCGQRCHDCTRCADHYQQSMRQSAA